MPSPSTGSGIDVTGHVNWDLAKNNGDAVIHADASDLRPLGTLLGQRLSGRVKAAIVLAPAASASAPSGPAPSTAAPSTPAQIALTPAVAVAAPPVMSASTPPASAAAIAPVAESADIHADVIDLIWQDLHLQHAALAVKAADIADPTAANGSLEVTNLTTGTTKVDHVAFTLAGQKNNRLAVTLATNGSTAGTPFAAKFAGLLSEAQVNDTKEQKIVVTAFTGSYDRKPFALETPSASITKQAGRITATPFRFRLFGGTLKFAGLVSPDKVNATLALSHIALESLPAPSLPKGTVEASVALTGTGAATDAAFDAALRTHYGEDAVSLTARGSWKNRALAAHATAEMGKAKATTDVRLASSLSLAPFNAGLSAGTQVTGAVTLGAPLDQANIFLRDSGQHVDGTLAAHAKLAGTLGSPTVNGTAELSGLRYDYPDSGVCLRGVDARITSNGKEVQLQSLSSKSQNGGSLSASGHLSLVGAKPLAARLAFSHFHLFCGGLAAGNIDGAIDASGSLNATTVAGKITLETLNVQLPGTAAGKAHIPQVKTVRLQVNAQGKPVKKTASAASVSSPVTLHVTLNAPDHIFVRGRGLDAEFFGGLAINGPATGPSVTGKFETRHGTFDVLDRNLKITTGAIRFEGAIPPSPFLDITAESTVESTTIDVSLTGPATKPVIALTSTPALPQDEVLALLLFGRSLSSLGPFQVAQLAQSAAELAGYNSGPGVLDKVRSFLGVDTLNVGTDSNNDVNVGAGKYITDKVYVGVTQGAKPESRSVTTEVEVRPHVSADTAITTDGQQSLGLQWKYDY